MTAISGSAPFAIHQLIDLIGGLILLIAAYYAVMARKAANPAHR